MNDVPTNDTLRHLDWDALDRGLDDDGYAVTPVPVLDPVACARLAAAFDDDGWYRSTVDMGRHRFGRGVYRYYGDGLPAEVAALREAAYPPLAAIANRWQQRLGRPRFPGSLDGLLERCRAAGQVRQTSLILRYRPGDWNALHQDTYGEVAFPLQLAVALTRPGTDFTGGETLLVEQRPRAQSRATAITVPQGHAVVFPNRDRPVPGARGHHRVSVRHGVSTVQSGTRLALGVIFHLAR
ncbi:MAG: proline hydroxylase [Actinomycetia bacterium]|nr:proline hydroxylase [Actinomycetes bacterium]